jgi:hypothetical protein
MNTEKMAHELQLEMAEIDRHISTASMTLLAAVTLLARRIMQHPEMQMPTNGGDARREADNG